MCYRLCAQPQYGGLPPGFHLGGYCVNLHDRERRPPTDFPYDMYAVGFELAPAAEVDPDLSSPRLKLYCAQFCECSGLDSQWEADKDGFWDEVPQPSSWSQEAGDLPGPLVDYMASHIRLERPNFWPFANYFMEHQPRTRTHHPRGVLVIQDDHSVARGMNGSGQSLLKLSSNVANVIVCDNAWKPSYIDRPHYLLRYPEYPDFNPNSLEDNWKRPETRMCASPFGWGEV